MWVQNAGMAMLGEQDTADDPVDAKQQDVGSSAEPVAPAKSYDNDGESSDGQRVSQVKAPAPKHASKNVNQRTIAKSRK